MAGLEWAPAHAARCRNASVTPRAIWRGEGPAAVRGLLLLPYAVPDGRPRLHAEYSLCCLFMSPARSREVGTMGWCWPLTERDEHSTLVRAWEQGSQGCLAASELPRRPFAGQVPLAPTAQL